MEPLLVLAERCEKASWPDQSGCRSPLSGLLSECAVALREAAKNREEYDAKRLQSG